MSFPTRWYVYRLPEALLGRLEASYRTELVRGCPAADDDGLFARGVVETSVTWALTVHHLTRPLEKLLEQDRALVALTNRRRFLLYLQEVVLRPRCLSSSQQGDGRARLCQPVSQALT